MQCEANMCSLRCWTVNFGRLICFLNILSALTTYLQIGCVFMTKSPFLSQTPLKLLGDSCTSRGRTPESVAHTIPLERMKLKLPARRSSFGLLEERRKDISERDNSFALAGPSEGHFTVSTHKCSVLKAERSRERIAERQALPRGTVTGRPRPGSSKVGRGVRLALLGAFDEHALHSRQPRAH